MPYTIITGASAGIGYETAKGLASIGHNLILVARNYEKLKQIKKNILLLRLQIYTSNYCYQRIEYLLNQDEGN